jgi:hypothetical protein
MGRKSGFVLRDLFQHGVVAGNSAWISGRDTLRFDRVVDDQNECTGRS